MSTRGRSTGSPSTRKPELGLGRSRDRRHAVRALRRAGFVGHAPRAAFGTRQGRGAPIMSARMRRWWWRAVAVAVVGGGAVAGWSGLTRAAQADPPAPAPAAENPAVWIR